MCIYFINGPKGLSVLIFLTPLATILNEVLVSDGNPLADIFSTVKPAGFNVTDDSITEAAISSLCFSPSACVWSCNMRGDRNAISDCGYDTWRMLCGFGLDMLS